jgi:DNA mismatch repair ATPase MutS
LGLAVDPMMVPLFADLARVMRKTTAPVAKQLKCYSEIQGRMFTALRNDLIFYLGAVHLLRSLMEHGLPVCRPDIAPQIDRRCEVSDSYNLNLALHMIEQDSILPDGITLNEIKIGRDGRILILTGPNRGGKTTYMQGIGLVQLLAQIGCYVPGTSALISPVDQIYTHFPLEEQPDADTGRFGDEAARIAKIFEQVTRNSLVLLNESLSSTSLGESLYLAQDIVRILRRLGARAIFSTHIHELAERAGEMNASTPGDSQIASIVSSPLEIDPQISAVGIRRSYKVEFRPPLGLSFAREIAARYGISYEQLEKALMERGELSNSTI